jgi:3-oxoacyl-[acyl-carrier protein] reductase
VAERLLADGWDVTALVRRDVTPAGARVVVGDATDPAAITAALAAAAPDGHLDALVCAAGVPPSGPWDAPDHWIETLAVDLTAPYDAARLAWPALAAAHGSVVMVGSIVGAHEGSTRSPAYSAAKAGLEGLARSLAVIAGRMGSASRGAGAIDTSLTRPFRPSTD